MLVRSIIYSLLKDVFKFFIAYSIFAIIVEKVTSNVPKSWDPTGVGMLAMIILFIGFVIGAFKIGASYSDSLEEQRPGTILGVYRRPLRSVKYGVVSLLLNFGLVYLVLVISDLFSN